MRDTLASGARRVVFNEQRHVAELRDVHKPSIREFQLRNDGKREERERHERIRERTAESLSRAAKLAPRGGHINQRLVGHQTGEG